MAKSPGKGGGKGKSGSAQPAPSAGLPRYDDRPEVGRRGSGASSQENPSIPRYGDDEPGDPRRARSDAVSDDAEIAEDELDVTGDDDDEEEDL